MQVLNDGHRLHNSMRFCLETLPHAHESSSWCGILLQSRTLEVAKHANMPDSHSHGVVFKNGSRVCIVDCLVKNESKVSLHI